MKVKITITQSLGETVKYTDKQTGNVSERYVATVAGLTEYGEMVSLRMYAVSASEVALPKPNSKILADISRYESANALMGSGTMRGYVEAR